MLLVLIYSEGNAHSLRTHNIPHEAAELYTHFFNKGDFQRQYTISKQLLQTALKKVPHHVIMAPLLN